MTSDLRSAARQLESVGKSLTASLTVPLTIAGGAIVKLGSEFEASMSKLAAVTGATGKTFDDLQSKAMEMGSSTQYSATQAADAMTELAKAGMTSEQTIAAIPGVLSMAATENMELATAAEITSAILNGFSLEAEKAGMVADVLAMNSNMSATGVEAIGAAMAPVAGFASQLGLSFTDVNAALGIMANNGIDGAVAGQKLMAILRALVAPSSGAAKTMKQLGIEVFDANGKMKQIPEVIDIISEKTKGMGDQQKLAALKTIFGTEAMQGLLPLLKEGGSAVQDYSDQLANSTGYADETAAAINDNLKGALTALGSAVETAAISLYQNIGPALSEFVKWITKLVQSFANLSPNTQKFIVTMAALLAAVGPVLIIISKLVSIAGKIKAAFVMAKAATTAFGAATALVGGPINLIVIAILAVIAVVAALIIYWDDIAKVTVEVWNAICDFLSGICKSIGGTLTGAWKGIKESAISIWNSIVDFFSGIGSGIYETLTSFWGSIKDTTVNVWNSIVDFFSGIGEAIGSTLSSAWESLKESAISAWNSIKDVTTQIWTSIKDFFIGVWQGMVDFFTPIVNSIKDIITSVWNVIYTITSSIWSYIIQYLVAIWTAILYYVTPIFEAISEFIANIWNSIKETAISIWNTIVSSVAGIWESFIEFANQVWSSITLFFEETWNSIKETAISIWESIVTYLTQLWESIKEQVIQIWNTITDFLTSVWEGIKNVAIEIWNSILEMLSAIWNAIWTTTVSIFTSIKNAIVGPINAAKEGIISAFKTAATTLASIWNGIKNTATSVWNSILSTISSIVTNIVSKVTSAFNGLKKGVLGAFNALKSGIKAVLNGIISGINIFIDGFNIPAKLLNKIPGVDAPIIPHIPMLATGGTIFGNGQAIVGEDGPELISKSGSSVKVTPLSSQEKASGISGAIGSDGGVNINVANMSVRSDEDITRISRALYQEIQRSKKSKGSR